MMIATAPDGLPSSRGEAKGSSIRWYFTGKPCKHGSHIAPRYTNNGSCVVCACDKLHRQRHTEEKETIRRLRKKKFYEIQHNKALTAIRRRGEVYLHGQYKDKDSLYGVCCPHNHEYIIPFSRLVNKSHGCRQCYYDSLRFSFAIFSQHVIKRGGTLLETFDNSEWHGTKTLVRIRCANGHDFENRVHNIIHNGSWCQTCNSYIGERIMRAILEHTFGEPFIHLRPKWLLSPSGMPMELDGYCEALRLAFEYDGPYHSRPSQMIRDKEKRRICEDRGIMLISVPAVNPFPPENVRVALDKAMRTAGLNIIPILPDIDFTRSELVECQNYAKSKGNGQGRFLSSQFGGRNKKHEWWCGNTDHPSWWQTPSIVMNANTSRPNGTWCPTCANILPLSLDYLREWCRPHGIVPMEYKNSNTNIPFRCLLSHDHKFVSRFTNVQRAINNDKPACQICRRAVSKRGGPKPVICLNTNEIFRSATDAGAAKNCQASHITTVCRGKRRIAGGLQWAYARGL